MNAPEPYRRPGPYMSALRTLEQVRAAGRADGAADPPLTQDQADLVACILAPHQKQKPASKAA